MVYQNKIEPKMLVRIPIPTSSAKVGASLVSLVLLSCSVKSGSQNIVEKSNDKYNDTYSNPTQFYDDNIQKRLILIYFIFGV
jgi:hypothetical protein